MAEFSPTVEMDKIGPLADEFYKNILFDEEPLFVGDEANLLDVWSGDVTEILDRCSAHYGVPVTLEDAKQPLWKLIPRLTEKRPQLPEADIAAGKEPR